MTMIVTTTTIKIKTCPENVNICLNSATCLILNDLTIYCSCNTGYSGYFKSEKLILVVIFLSF